MSEEISRKVKPEKFLDKSISKLTDPERLATILNGTRKLTDDDFEDFMHADGFRVALWWMRKAAIEGDYNLVRACDIYLKRCDASRSRRKKPDSVRDITPDKFLPEARQEQE